MTVQLKTEFDEQDLEFAKAFCRSVEKFEIDDNEIAIRTVETENDSLTLGPFSIQLVEGVRVETSILGEVSMPCTEFVVLSDIQTYSFAGGEEWDVEEIAREPSLADALKACALKDYEWGLDNVLNGISEEQERKRYPNGQGLDND